MSTASTNGFSQGPHTTEAERSSPRVRAGTTRVEHLDELVGAHPNALRAIYAGGAVTDPRDLGDAPQGRLLGLAPTEDIHFLVRPLIRALASGVMPWRGKVFDARRPAIAPASGSGANIVFGRRAGLFSYAEGTSALDGRPALILRYDGQPWPLARVTDELRTIGDGIAIGPALFLGSGAPSVLLWFGLMRIR